MDHDAIFSLKNRDVLSLVCCRAKDSISTELDGETVIMDVVSGTYSGLDPVGTFIWNRLSTPISIACLRDAVTGRYDVAEEQCTADLLAFLRDLAENGLIYIEEIANDR